MTSFSDLLTYSQTATAALNAVEESSASRMTTFFLHYESGFSPFSELRIEVLNQAYSGWITAGSIAVEHVRDVAAASGVTRLDTPVLQQHPVLNRLLDDIRKNLEAYDEDARDEKAYRRLKFRLGLSVQTAVRRSFTEHQIAMGKILEKHGAALKKVWLANFDGNTPCSACRDLHGTEVSLGKNFPHGDERAPGVYEGLPGPPRHPNCHCYMLVYVVTLETHSFVPKPPIEFVQPEQYMSAKDVRRLPRGVFTAVLATLRLIAGKLRGVLGGDS